MDNKNATGLKGMIQSLVPEAPGIIEGIVTNVSPLQVTLVNDAKMILGKNSLIIPRHLTDYAVEVDLQSDDTLIGETTADGEIHKIMQVHNCLKNGDTVYLLQFNSGKKFYILDKKG